jgi:hypothetical protein
MKRSIVSVFACIAFLSAIAAHAEGGGDCSAKQYPLKPEERAFFSKFTVLRAAVPKPPKGWQYSDDGKEVLAKGYKYLPASECEISNYYIGLDVGYSRPMTQADMDKVGAAMQAKPDPAKQKKLDGLMAQQQALMQKMVAAAQKQDAKTMDGLSKQNDALTVQINALQQDMNAGSSAAMSSAQQDRQAKVRLAINDAAGDVTCYGNPQFLKVPGAVAYACENPATYSSPGDVLDSPKGRIVVVFGKGVEANVEEWTWKDASDKEHKDHYVSIKTPLDQTITIGVQYVIVDVEGDDLARAQSLYKQINLKPLGALVSKH